MRYDEREPGQEESPIRDLTSPEDESPTQGQAQENQETTGDIEREKEEDLQT